MLQDILEIIGKLLFLTWYLWITFTVADLSRKIKRVNLPTPSVGLTTHEAVTGQICPSCDSQGYYHIIGANWRIKKEYMESGHI